MTWDLSAKSASNVTPNELADSGYAWRRLGYTALIGVICNASLWASVALMPAIQAEFALTRAEASHPYIAIMAGFLLGSPILGRMTDRLGITVVLIASTLTVSLGYVAGVMATNLPLFLLAQFVVGLGSAVGFAPLTADLTHWFTRRRGLAVSVGTGLISLSGLFWAAVTTGALQHGSWREVHLYIACGVLSAIPLSFLLRKRVPRGLLDAADAASDPRMTSIILPAPAVKWVLALAGICCCTAMAVPSIHIVAICSDLGYTFVQGSQLMSTMIVAGVISRLAIGLIIDRIGPLPILLLSSTVQMLSLLLYIPMQGLISLHLVTVIFGLAQGGILPAYPLIVRQYLPARSAGSVIGFVGMGTLFGMAFGGWLSGWLYDLSGAYALPFVSAIAWNLVNLAVVGLFSWRFGTCRTSAGTSPLTTST